MVRHELYRSLNLVALYLIISDNDVLRRYARQTSLVLPYDDSGLCFPDLKWTTSDPTYPIGKPSARDFRMAAKEPVRIPIFAISTAIGLEGGPATKRASGRGKSISRITGMSQDILKTTYSSKTILMAGKRIDLRRAEMVIF